MASELLACSGGSPPRDYINALIICNIDIGTISIFTASIWSSAGLVVGSDSKKSSPSKLQALGASINIMDRWARVYLARLCAALLYADWASAIEFAKGPGQPFWRMLTQLATMYVARRLTPLIIVILAGGASLEC